MKKLSLLMIIIISVCSFYQAKAQNENVTSKTATKKNGYTRLNNDGVITLYKYIHASHSPKEAEKYKPKYFFTTPSSDVLQPLTKDNIKNAFPDNHPFHDALDATISSDQDLTMYDTFHKMYKLNWLLKEHP